MHKNISFHMDHIEMSDALMQYLETRMASIQKYIDMDSPNVLCEVRMRRAEPNHHKQGEHIYHIDITIRNGAEVVRADADREDMYTAIDEVKDDIIALLRKHRGRSHSRFLGGVRKVKKLLRLD